MNETQQQSVHIGAKTASGEEYQMVTPAVLSKRQCEERF